jgi:hypothetical protein
LRNRRWGVDVPGWLAFPGLLEIPVVPENPAEPYSCLPGIIAPTTDDADPSRVLDRAMTTMERPAGNDDEARRRYEEVYARLTFHWALRGKYLHARERSRESYMPSHAVDTLAAGDTPAAVRTRWRTFTRSG